MSIFNNAMMATGQVQNEPGFIVGPISWFLGQILDFVYNLAYAVTGSGLALGLSIILFTIIVRMLLLPLAIKTHKSMANFRKVAPQMQAIKDKYAGSKDPELMKKQNMEIQQLYAENGANPISGCLPALLQMPIFITLFFMMRQPYLYITRLGDVYSQIAGRIMDLPVYRRPIFETLSLGYDRLPSNLDPALDLEVTSDFIRLLNTYSPANWTEYLSQLYYFNTQYLGDRTSYYLDYIHNLVLQMDGMETFLSIRLVQESGWAYPAVAIPILAAATTFASSYQMTKQNAMQANPAMQTQQKIILYIMPFIMGMVTVGAPAGVGIYWITSNVFQFCQQFVLQKFYNKKDDNEVVVVEK